MKKNKLIIIYTLLFCVLCGLVSTYFYYRSPSHAIEIEKFQSVLNSKEEVASATLLDIEKIIGQNNTDSIISHTFKNNDISYYVFENNDMVFWSDNHLDISNFALPDTTNWQYVHLPNADCVCRVSAFDKYKLLALIKIKNNYPYENDELQNTYAQGFEIDKQVQILNDNNHQHLDVRSSSGAYLFSLSDMKKPIFNETWSIIGLVAFSLAFLLFFIIYAQAPYLIGKKYIQFKTFSIISLIVFVFISLCLYFNIPEVLLLNKLFSPFQYASNPLLSSISHLTIVSAYFLATIHLLYFHVNTDILKKNGSRLMLQILYSLYFGLVFYLMSGLIYHSSIQLTILRFEDFSTISIWAHFLILLWGISLTIIFYKTHHWYNTHQKLNNAFATDILLAFILSFICWIFSSEDSMRLGAWYSIITILFYIPYLFPKFRNIYGLMAIWILGFTSFLIVNSYIINDNLKFQKYKLLAQNINVNGNFENDRMADILLEELDLKINNDQKFKKLIQNPDSLIVANKYVNERYLRGFWNKYEMRMNVALINTDLYRDYDDYIDNVGSKLKDTHFYSVPANENNMSYIGAFPVNFRNDSLEFYMEFYPRRNFKSYSFPNLLISSTPDILTKLNLTIARYENNNLVYSSGNEEYPTNANWISTQKTDIFKIIHNGKVHYILNANAKTKLVLTEQQLYNPVEYLYYFMYTFLAFFAVSWLLIWSFQLFRKKRNYRLGLTAKFQYAFILLLIISFLGIFYVSVNFIQQKYRKEQIANLESKKSYIQKNLQDMYYWSQDLNAMNTQNLNFDLQDLSYIYHTDIHIYNNYGVLVGSSQPLIFNKSLISNRISPVPFFTQKANVNQYEHIGKLNYLTGYTDFYNGDYLQIGYIAIPQFFSQTEIRAEIESFLTVIIHIYIIVIVLAILISLLIGKQLSAPLIMIQTKLKEMRLGERNEKIEYALNDEIGQLVMQYNRTLDELEHSAQLLSKSERETAWKSMARQVAHEINNPLTPMKLTIQQMQRTKKMNDERFDDYFSKSTDMLIEQIDNLSRIAGTFSNFARMPEAKFEKVDIAAKLHSVVQLFRNNNEEIQIKFNGDDTGIFVYADPEQLVQVFNNLLKNAIQSIPANRNGKIQVNLKSEGSKVLIEVIDNGAGIEDEIKDKLFVPNFTTKNTGMGLGLAICKNIIELSGGNIGFSTKINEGTVFSISLVLAD